MTDWKWILIVIAPLAAITENNKNTLADVFANNGSGESAANERKMFDNVARLALASSPTVLVARGFTTPVKVSMRDALELAMDTINTPLSNANKIRYYAIAAVDLPQYDAGDLIKSNRATVEGLYGSPFGWQDALTDLGLVVMAAPTV